MWRPLNVFVYLLCFGVGQRVAVGQTTTSQTTTIETTTDLPTTQVSYVCEVTSVTACIGPSTSDGTSTTDCKQQGTWIANITVTDGIAVVFTPSDAVAYEQVSDSTTDGVTTFQYNISCCYSVMKNEEQSDSNCTLDISETPTGAAIISFPEDTFAHVAIGCGGAIVLMVGLVFALGAICNKDQKKGKYKEDGAEQRRVEQPRPQSQDTPRRPALDAVFDTGQRSGSRTGHADRIVAENREHPQRYEREPYEDPRGQNYAGYDNWSFQDDDRERSRQYSEFAAPPREHQPRAGNQPRRQTEAPYPYDNRYDHHAEAARNFNHPYDRYDRRGGDRYDSYSEMPQYDRDRRMGPPADFDMY